MLEENVMVLVDFTQGPDYVISLYAEDVYIEGAIPLNTVRIPKYLGTLTQLPPLK
jgi:hypothetical protein